MDPITMTIEVGGGKVVIKVLGDEVRILIENLQDNLVDIIAKNRGIPGVNGPDVRLNLQDMINKENKAK